MKIFSIIAMCLALGACQTTQQTLTITKFQRIEIPSQLLDCDQKIVKIPANPSKLTNKQITGYIIEMNKVLDECQGDVSDVKLLIEKFNQEIKNTNERSKQ